MIKYVFRDDEPIRIKAAKNADPQVIGEALEKIAKGNGGKLKPDDVWKAAQERRHPLHKHFEWDVQKAAEAHWRDTSRALIRMIRVEDEEVTEGTTRAFHSISDKGGTSYRHIDEVRSSADFQLSLLNAAERDLESFRLRYRELKDVCGLIDQAREAVNRRRSNIENETRASA